jgi:hypothetical protein
MKMKMKSIFLGAALLFVALLSCNKEPYTGGGSTDTGKGGSLARFTIVGNVLYTLTETSIISYNITNPSMPVVLDSLHTAWQADGVETIFAMGNNLFIGGSQGVHLFEIGIDGKPIYRSFYSHFKTCDPVVAQGQYAYSTIRSGSPCRINTTGTTNELHVINISNINAPTRVITVPLTFPLGLGIDGNTLFVCDEGLRVFDVSQPNSPRQTHHLKDVSALDVIPLNGLLLVIGDRKLTQINYKNLDSLRVYSTLNLQ